MNKFSIAAVFAAFFGIIITPAHPMDQPCKFHGLLNVAVRDVFSLELHEGGVIKLVELRLANLVVYKVMYEMDGFSDACQYMAFIKGNQKYVLLTLGCQESVKALAKLDQKAFAEFGEAFDQEIRLHCFAQASALGSLLNLQLMKEYDNYNASCNPQDYFACALCSDAEITEMDGGRAFFTLVDTQTANNPLQARFNYVCRNIMFIRDAKKGRTAEIRATLAKTSALDCLPSGTLEIALDLATDPEIKEMIKATLELRGQSLQ